MDLILTVISWVLFVFYMMLGVGLVSSWVGWLFLLQAVLVMPVKPILRLWKAIGKVKLVKYLVLIALLCVTVWQLPPAVERIAQAKQMEAEQEAAQSEPQAGQSVEEPEEIQPIVEVTEQETAEAAEPEKEDSKLLPEVAKPVSGKTPEKDDTKEKRFEFEEDPVVDKNSDEAKAVAAYLQNLPDGVYVVNGKNGMIHMKGKCSATDPNAANFMLTPIPCDSIEKAEDASFWIDQDITGERRCKKCFP